MISFRKGDIVQEGEAMAALLRETFDQSIFTVDYLVWKHVQNPAGKSFVLIAEEDSRLVGLRIFMLWDFHINGRAYKALRPVDTAVHKDYQGKGLFKKLTLQGLDMMKGNFDFIFNTPNNNSLPGYLKMGWTKIDSEAAFYFTPVIPLPKKTSFVEDRKLDSSEKVTDFIKWRYSSSRYKWATFSDHSMIIYRIEKRRFFNLVVIVDSFFTKQNLKRNVKSICSREKALGYIFLFSKKTQMLKSFFSSKRGSPVIVSKDANGILDQFNFALGDVEGIL
jgi:hypothetical protein